MESQRVFVGRDFGKRAVVGCLVAVLTGCGTGDGAGPRPPGLPDPAALAAEVGAIDHALTVPALQSLGALAVPLFLSGIEVHSISPITIGKTFAWNPGSQRFLVSDSVGLAPGAMRVLLYAIDSTSGLPAIPLVVLGAVDLFAQSHLFNPQLDTTALRYVVHDTGATATVYADFRAWSVFNPSCLCATVTGWVSDGATRVDFSAPYHVIFEGPGVFPGAFTAAPQNLRVSHAASLPALGDSLVSVDAQLGFLGDSLHVLGSLYFHSAGPPTASLSVLVNGQQFATGIFQHGIATFTGTGGRALSADEQRAVAARSLMPFELALNLEVPDAHNFLLRLLMCLL